MKLLTAEPTGSTLLIPKPTTGQNPNPVSSASYPHNLFPDDPF
jgi:hypothetical protein